jgi:hypothetical protein
MIAQGPWFARPRRLDAIVADGHPVPDLKYFEVHPLPCPSVGHLEFCAVRSLSPTSSISAYGHLLCFQGVLEMCGFAVMI